MTITSLGWLLGAIGVLSLFQRSALTLLTAVFDAALRVLGGAHHWLRSAAQELRSTRDRLLRDVDLDGGRMRVTFYLGALGAAGAALWMSLCEGSMVVYAMEALFGETLSDRLPPFIRNLGGMFTAGLVVAGLVAAWCFEAVAPDSRSKLIVLDWYGPSARRLLRWCAGGAAVAVLVSVVGLATVRSAGLDEAQRLEAVTETANHVAGNPQPTTAEAYQHVMHVARWVVGVSSAVAFLLAAVPVFAFAYDGLQLVPPLAVTMVLMVATLARWLIAAVAGLAAGARYLIALVIRAVAWVGNPIARPFVELLRRLHRWAGECPSRGVARAFRGLVAVLTALGDDVQVPDAGERQWAHDPPNRGRALSWDEA